MGNKHVIPHVGTPLPNQKRENASFIKTRLVCISYGLLSYDLDSKEVGMLFKTYMKAECIDLMFSLVNLIFSCKYFEFDACNMFHKKLEQGYVYHCVTSPVFLTILSKCWGNEDTR